MLQRAAARFRLPARLHEASGEPPAKRRVGDSDDQGVPRGEVFQPGRGVVDPRGLCCRGILPPESQEQGPPADGECPPQERETKPAKIGTFEIELA